MRTILAAWVLVAAASPAAAQDWVQFQSPTGNIHCMIFAGDGDWQGARCDILQASRSFPSHPGCELDFGHAFEVSRNGQGLPICAGDTVADPRAPVLGYGQSAGLGGVTCTSERSGMTCRNVHGHGFTLSRARQFVF